MLFSYSRLPSKLQQGIIIFKISTRFPSTQGARAHHSRHGHGLGNMLKFWAEHHSFQNFSMLSLKAGRLRTSLVAWTYAGKHAEIFEPMMAGMECPCAEHFACVDVSNAPAASCCQHHGVSKVCSMLCSSSQLPSKL